MNNLKNTLLALVMLSCSPLLSMQQPPEQRWLLRVTVPQNLTPEQIAEQVNQSLENNELKNWTRALANEVWLSISGTRAGIVESLSNRPWFNENRLREEQRYAHPDSARERIREHINK